MHAPYTYVLVLDCKNLFKRLTIDKYVYGKSHHFNLNSDIIVLEKELNCHFRWIWSKKKNSDEQNLI